MPASGCLVPQSGAWCGRLSGCPGRAAWVDGLGGRRPVAAGERSASRIGPSRCIGQEFCTQQRVQMSATRQGDMPRDSEGKTRKAGN